MKSFKGYLNVLKHFERLGFCETWKTSICISTSILAMKLVVDYSCDSFDEKDNFVKFKLITILEP